MNRPAPEPEIAGLCLLTGLDPLAPMHAVEALADGVAATLRVARGLLDAKRQVDLAGLDRMVGPLCAKALDLAPEQGRLLRPRLQTLQQELDVLAARMRH